MLGTTHVAVGIATSLAILQPTTITDLIGTIVGSALGGQISDMDCKNLSTDNGTIPISDIVFATFPLIGALFFDYVFGNKIYKYAVSHFGIKTVLGISIFFICCIRAFVSAHRTFTHSFLGLILFSFSIALIYFPVAKSFFIGFLSHLILDIVNMKGLQLLFPLKKRFCFKLCYSNGKANSVIRNIAVIISVVLSAWLFIWAFSNEDNNLQYNTHSFLPWLSVFQWYLIAINVITFFIFLLDYWICTNTIAIEDENFIHSILNIFGIIGGSLGMLLSFLVLRQKIGKHNANWYAIAISLTISWFTIYCILYDPFHVGFEGIKPEVLSHLLIVLYLVLINTISLVIFFVDREKFRPKWTSSEFGLFLLGLVGGSLGGLIAITITGKKEGFPHFAFGFSVMLAMHTIVVAYLLLSGLA